MNGNSACATRQPADAGYIQTLVFFFTFDLQPSLYLVEVPMGQQHRKSLKRIRRKRYEERVKERNKQAMKKKK